MARDLHTQWQGPIDQKPLQRSTVIQHGSSAIARRMAAASGCPAALPNSQRGGSESEYPAFCRMSPQKGKRVLLLRNSSC